MKKNKNFKLLIRIFLIFFKIGSFTFGGGYAMIPLIEKEVIKNNGWVDEDEIVDVFAVAQSLPGAIAINSSTFIGSKIAGWSGAIAATLGVILPSFFIIAIIAAFFSSFQKYPITKAVFAGIRPAIVGLILVAAYRVGKSAVKDTPGFIILLAAVFLIILGLHPIFAISGGALTGFLTNFLFPLISKKKGKKDISI